MRTLPGTCPHCGAIGYAAEVIYKFTPHWAWKFNCGTKAMMGQYRTRTFMKASCYWRMVSNFQERRAA